MARLCVKCIFEEFVYVYTRLMLHMIALELMNKIVIKFCILVISLSGKFISCFFHCNACILWISNQSLQFSQK